MFDMGIFHSQQQNKEHVENVHKLSNGRNCIQYFYVCSIKHYVVYHLNCIAFSPLKLSK